MQTENIKKEYVPISPIKFRLWENLQDKLFLFILPPNNCKVGVVVVVVRDLRVIINHFWHMYLICILTLKL